MIELKFDYSDLDLSCWFPEGEEENAQAATEGLRNTFELNPPSIEFESDAETIIVHLSLTSKTETDGWIYMEANIDKMISDYIERTRKGEMLGGDEAKVLLAQRLRSAASKLEEAVKHDSDSE